MSVTGELEGAYNWQVVVNGEALGQGEVSSQNIKETTKLQIAVAQLLADEAAAEAARAARGRVCGGRRIQKSYQVSGAKFQIAI
mgnify:CR=1 FL=1